MAFKMNNLLLQRKQIQMEKSAFVQEENRFSKVRIELAYQIKRFSAYLTFETHQSVQNRRIDKGNVKFSRCQKALSDNAKEGFYDKNSPMKHVEKLELVDAFKIENQILLKDFETKLRKQKDSFLKGLFVMVSKKQLLEIILFGFQNVHDKQDVYRQKFLRIPQTFLKNNQSVIEKLLKDHKPCSFEGPIKAYASPACQQLKDKII